MEKIREENIKRNNEYINNLGSINFLQVAEQVREPRRREQNETENEQVREPRRREQNETENEQVREPTPKTRAGQVREPSNKMNRPLFSKFAQKDIPYY